MKVYVEVQAVFGTEGQLRPTGLTWRDGRKYTVDRVLRVQRCASRKAGGAGIMYTCRIRGQEVHLFFEEDRWFVDAVEDGA